MKDVTRETGLAFQQGVKAAQRWEFGPFSAFHVEYSSGLKSYGVQVLIFGYSLQVALSEAQ